MKFEHIDPPRRFRVGATRIELLDCARIALQPDEQVTFTTPDGGEYDVVRKDWGFYATPSTNARLPRHGLHAVLVRNEHGHCFVMLVEEGKRDLFEAYCRAERQTPLLWLDDEAALADLPGRTSG